MSQFSISFTLTEAGFQAYNTIIEKTFEWLKFITDNGVIYHPNGAT
jgi:secreted Zn-dependent insulinase-like peptidase